MGSKTGNLQEMPEKAIERAVILGCGQLYYKAHRNYITLIIPAPPEHQMR